MKRYRFYIAFFFAVLAVHFFLPLNWADDAVFYEKAASTSLDDFLLTSARPLTDAATWLFAKVNLAWRISNPLVLTVFLAAVEEILPIRKSKVTKAVLLFAVFPSMVLVDAGFIATTVNYLWPITFGLLCLFPIRNKLLKVKTPLWYKLAIIPLLAYACNMQQMCAVLLGVLLCTNVYIWTVRKEFDLYVLFQNVAVAAMAVYSYSLNVFSDNSRMLRETARYFPGFGSLNIFEKAELGFSSTFYCMTMELRLAFVGFIIFALFLAVCGLRLNIKPALKAASVFPFVFSLGFGALALVKPEWVKAVCGGMVNGGVGKADYVFSPVSDLLFLLVLICFAVSVVSLLKTKTSRMISALILAAGFGSRILMGFSPTVWASGYRTFAILFVSFILAALLIINESSGLSKDNPE
ncbi:MAG: hypothetical protein IKK09_12355 [Clostridia bacterium]|nr:hypothetical protein [Clostridia bacterium]